MLPVEANDCSHFAQADPMKPTLDRMIEMISGALDGDAKDFYQREFAFFDEVTSISAKLKPYIKAPKPEKKVRGQRRQIVLRASVI